MDGFFNRLLESAPGKSGTPPIIDSDGTPVDFVRCDNTEYPTVNRIAAMIPDREYLALVNANRECPPAAVCQVQLNDLFSN